MTVSAVVLAFAILLIIVFLHELAHAGVARLMGHKISGFYIGIPIEFTRSVPWRQNPVRFSTVLVRWKTENFEIGLSWLLLGGAVLIDVEKMTLRQKLLVYLYGPAMNIMLALGGALVILGLNTGWEVNRAFLTATIQSIQMMFSGSVGIQDLSGPAGIVEMTSQVVHLDMGILFVWLLLNTSLAVTNILPIPALDGGQCILSFVSHFGGKVGKLWAHRLSFASFCILLTLMLSLTVRDFL